MTRPVKLQINQRGAWRDVMSVDMDRVVLTSFLVGAATMVQASGNMDRTTMRIVTDGSPSPDRLMTWSAAGGWEKVGTP